MHAAHPLAPAELLGAVAGRFVLRGLRWRDYEALLEAREESSWPRIIYLDWLLEFVDVKETGAVKRWRTALRTTKRSGRRRN